VSAIGQGEDDIALSRDISGNIFLRIAGEEVKVPR